MNNPFEKLGNITQNYVDVRPAYPENILDELDIFNDTVVADIGAGTGKLTAQLLLRTNNIWAIEPSADIREGFFAALPDFPVSHFFPTSAEHTKLAANKFDLVTYGQCWHWLDEGAALKEASRILRPQGKIAILFNQFDVSVPWVLRLSKVMRSGDVHRINKPPRLEKKFVNIEFFSTTWEDTIYAKDLLKLGTTRTSWIKSDTENRQRMQDNLRSYLYDELGYSDVEPIKLPYHTYMWTAQIS